MVSLSAVSCPGLLLEVWAVVFFRGLLWFWHVGVRSGSTVLHCVSVGAVELGSAALTWEAHVFFFLVDA